MQNNEETKKVKTRRETLSKQERKNKQQEMLTRIKNANPHRANRINQKQAGQKLDKVRKDQLKDLEGAAETISKNNTLAPSPKFNRNK